MRRRRALLAVATVFVLGAGAAGATLAVGGGSGVVPRAAAASYPGPAVRLATCSVLQKPRGCRSPDRRWSVVMGTDGLDCHVSVRHAGTRSFKPAYDSRRGGCDTAVWVEPHLLLFGQGGLGGPYRVLSLDAASGTVRPVANFLAFAVSANERWLTGELRPKGAPPLVAVVSLHNHECRVVAQAHGSNQSVLVAPGGGAVGLGPPTGSPFRQSVGWIREPNRHGKLSVASGPGVGFTRDSKSLIVAVDHWSDKTGAYHRRLVRIPLSASHGPCPALVTARSVQKSAFGAWPYFRPRHPTGFPLTLHIQRSRGRISSIKVTVTTAYHDSVLRLLVLRGSPLGSGGPAPNHPAVFQERVRMTNLPGHGDLPAGLPLATWTGTLSPTTWKGGCESKRYEVYAEIGPAKPAPKHVYTPQDQALGSAWFRCQA